MKKCLLLLTAFFFCSVAFSQINYQKTLQQTFEKARNNKKLIFVMITPPQFSGFASMKSGINNDTVADYYNKNFVSFSTSIADTASMRKLSKFQIGSTFPCYLFIDGNNELVYKSTGNTIAPSQYLLIGKEAITRNNSGRTLTFYEDRYKNGKIDASFLKDYITLKEEIGLYDNAKLIDRYVDFLTIGDLNNYQNVLFILKAGPYAYGKAYGLAYTNKKVADSIFKTEPLQLRVAINNRITVNTRMEAITTKNLDMAQKASNFTRNTWGSDYRRGNREAQNDMLIYYKSIKDTANYYRQAEYFYDNNYMRISTDSAKKLSDAVLSNIKKRGPAGVNSIVKMDTSKVKSFVTMRQAGLNSPADPISIALNTGAWEFYTMGTKDNAHLAKAMLWSKRSIALSPDNYAYYDTYAHLLYRLNLFADAENNQAEAIKLAQENKLDDKHIDSLKDELKKMKQRKL